MSESIIILRRFGDTVKHHRLRLGISQEEMGWRGDLHRNDAGHFERAERMPRAEVLLRVAAALGISMRELLKGMRWKPPEGIPGRYVFAEVEDLPPRRHRPEPPTCAVPGFFTVGDKAPRRVGGRAMSAPPNPEMKTRFGENLERLRERAGLTQAELGYRASLHRTEISLLERGLRLPRIDTAVKLAGCLSVSLDELATGIGWNPGYTVVVEGGFEVAEPKPVEVMTFPDAARARFASNVARLREEAGFSQEVMADRSAVSTAMISKVEGGKVLPYFDVVIRMAGALSTTPSALVEGITWKPGEIVESDPQDYTLADG